jgi:hypothetical protein
VLGRSAAPDSDPEWIMAVQAVLERELAIGPRRSMLLVRRGTGRWFHATRSENRDSIRRFGLDWTRMGDTPGIAGSQHPERPGVFLCRSLQSAYWFATMPRQDLTDIWAARVEDVWLETDPSAGGGGDQDWMICPQPIASEHLELIKADIPSGRST